MSREGILLLSGEMYNYQDPHSNVFDIEDVATGLSKICRFAGHLPVFYSVAQHSYYVSYCVDERYALDGLLHDATEAFLVDVPTPLKAQLPDYQRLERLHEAYVLSRFGVDYPLHKEVHRADKAVFAAEVRDLRPDDWEAYGLDGVIPFEWYIDPWPPNTAKQMFLQRYKELVARRIIH